MIKKVTPAVTVRPLNVIAREIRKEWQNVYFGAVPYLDAMGTLTDKTMRPTTKNASPPKLIAKCGSSGSCATRGSARWPSHSSLSLSDCSRAHNCVSNASSSAGAPFSNSTTNDWNGTGSAR